MKNTNINYLLVGGFVIAMVIALVVSVALLTGRTGATDPYRAEFGNVTGVKFGTQVVYEGYPIGQVEKVTPVEREGRMSFTLDLSVAKGWRIPEDSVAEIAAPGLLSAITIQISAGESPRVLDPGATLRTRQSQNVFAVISSVADQISDISETGVRPLLENLNATISGFNRLVEEDGTILVKEMSALAVDLSERLPGIVADIEGAARNLSEVASDKNARRISAILDDTGQLAGRLKETQGRLDHLIGQLDAAVADNRLDIDKTVVDLRYSAESVARHIDAINQNLEATSRNMFEFSRQIRANPGLLLGGTPPKDEAAR